VTNVAWRAEDDLDRRTPEITGRPPIDRWTEPGLRRIRVGLLGCGRIGQAVVATARAERDRLAAAGVDLTFVRALVRDVGKRRAVAVPVVDEAETFEMDDLDVLVEVLGGLNPARALVARALAAGVPVVTANKTLVAHEGHDLERLARRHASVLAYDGAVLAGVPFLGSLARRPLLSGAHRIAGIVNGTSHAITTALEAHVPFDRALADAVERGYAEPDSSADISGRDAAEKLTILLRLAGVASARVEQLTILGIDALTPEDFAAARRFGGTVKPVALADLSGDQPGAWVGPAFLGADHPLARATGVTNVLQISGAAGRYASDVPDIIFQGPGAGPSATAATIIDDIVEAIDATPARRPPAARRVSDISQPPVGPWFLRLTATERIRPEDGQALSTLGLPIARSARGEHWVAGLTGVASWRDSQRAVTLARARGFDALAFPACSVV
jgi:homoserine dehydrogenase